MNFDGQSPPGSSTPSPKRKKAFQTSPGSPRKRVRTSKRKTSEQTPNGKFLTISLTISWPSVFTFFRAPTDTRAGPDVEPDPLASSSCDLATLLAESDNTTHEWFRRPNTSQQYAKYVKAGKEWLRVWVTESEELSERAEEPVGGRQASETEVPTEGIEDIPPGLGSASLEDRRQYADAFDSITDKTPDALRLFTAWKCEIFGRQYSTAEAIRAAFKDYFEQVLGCRGNTWSWDPSTRKATGNPVFESTYSRYFKSLQNRTNRTKEVVHARAMFPEDIAFLFAYLDGPDVDKKQFPPEKILFFKAFCSLCFRLWTRFEDLVNLKMGHLTWHSQPDNSYLAVNVVFTKVRQNINDGRTFLFPPEPDHPSIDCYEHVRAWLDCYSSKANRMLNEDDYVFPAWSRANIKMGTSINYDAFSRLLDSVINASGFNVTRKGRTSTHCFRRAAAQWHMICLAWSLRVVRWWAGWTNSENDSGTLMRYLIDVLSNYEQDYGDMWMPSSSQRRDGYMKHIGVSQSHDVAGALEKQIVKLASLLETAPGSNTTTMRSETTTGFDVLHTDREPIASVAAPVVLPAPAASFVAPAPHPEPAIHFIHPALRVTPTTSPFIPSTPPKPAAGYRSSAAPFESAAAAFGPPPAPIEPPLAPVEPPLAPIEPPLPPFEPPTTHPTPMIRSLISPMHPGPATGYISPDSSSQPPAACPIFTPGLIIPTIHSIHDVIRYWETGDIQHGLTVPLCKWMPDFYRSAEQKERVKWKNVSHVYEEYCRLGKNMDRFSEEYPGLQDDNRYSQLLDAVRERRKAMGLIKPRVRKR